MPLDHLKKHGMTAEEAFHWLWDSLRQGCCLVDPTTRKFIAVNRYLCELWGFTEGELQSTTFDKITVPTDAEVDIAEMQRLLSGEISSYTMTKSYFTKAGQVRTMDLHVIPIKNEAGVIVLLFSQVNLPLDRNGNYVPAISQTTTIRPAKQASLKNWLYDHGWKIGGLIIAILGYVYAAGQADGRELADKERLIEQVERLQETIDRLETRTQP
jgi:PAS domain S-box-containing protein